MKRRHNMPFGAEYSDEGKVRFRLWAPAARQVELCLADGNELTTIPLERHNQGWFELSTDAARSGTLYRFRIDGEKEVPDPASRFQPRDVHGPSEVIDPGDFDWKDEGWRGRNWDEAVIYELHVGAFTKSGTFSRRNRATRLSSRAWSYRHRVDAGFRFSWPAKLGVRRRVPVCA